MNDPTTLRQRVDRGSKLLDRKYGPEWVEEIDLGDLELRSALSCVLGQLYGGYSQGLEKLGSPVNPTQLGFTLGDEADTFNPGWGILNETWKEVIGERQGVEMAGSVA